MNDYLIPALRRLGAEGLPDCFRAADALEAQAARIAELETALQAIDGSTFDNSARYIARAALAPKEGSNG